MLSFFWGGGMFFQLGICFKGVDVVHGLRSQRRISGSGALAFVRLCWGGERGGGGEGT